VSNFNFSATFGQVTFDDIQLPFPPGLPTAPLQQAVTFRTD